MLAELVRRYWIQGMECSLLEIQKLAWFLERAIETFGLKPLNLLFKANKYGPYTDRLRYLLAGLDGTYLHCEKRISDADPLDVIWFDDERKAAVQTYLKTEAKAYTQALESAAALIDGFESPLGMELLATVDWLVTEMGATPSVSAIKENLLSWPGGKASADRKLLLFEDRIVEIALDALRQAELIH